MGLERILSKVENRPLDIYIDFCSGRRDRRSSCRKCVDVCPKSILKVGKRGLEMDIDLEVCGGCGLCAAVCPNGVFELRNPTDIALLKDIAGILSKAEKIVFGCSLDPAEGDVDMSLCGLGRLDESMLVAAAAMGAGEIVLVTGGCAGCQKSLGPSVLGHSVHNARKMLEAFGKETKIRLLKEAPERPVRPEEPEDVGLARRELFKRLREGTLTLATMFAQDKLEDIRESIVPSSTGPQAPSLKHRVPVKRHILNYHLQKLGEPVRPLLEGAKLPMADVSISEACTLCDCCVIFCPTGALTSTSTPEGKGISFDLSLCTNCGVCKLVCLDDAVSYGESVRVADLVSGKPRSLISQGSYKCQTCGREFGSSKPAKFCKFCERKRKLMNVPF